MAHIYISLGSDCSVAYQMHIRNLRHYAFPFDWIKMNNINDLIEILDNNFQFFEKEYLEIVRESNKFPLVDDEWNDKLNKNLIIKHKKYNILFPHEIKYDDDLENINTMIDNMCNKYKRRIDRFREIIKDQEIKKIFIRITDKKEIPELLQNCLGKISINFELRYIFLDKKTKYSSWKKDEVDWKF